MKFNELTGASDNSSAIDKAPSDTGYSDLAQMKTIKVKKDLNKEYNEIVIKASCNSL